jgi:hypothetical protein
MIMITRKISPLRPFLMAVTLATGFGTLWFALAVWLGTSIDEAWRGGNRPPREQFVVGSDGTPLIMTYPQDIRSPASFRDLNGRDHHLADRDEMLPAVYLAGEQATLSFYNSPLGWEHRLKEFVDEQDLTVNWFFVHDGKPQGAGYFVGYERVTNRLAGFIGLSGFRSHAMPASEWIPVRGELIMGYSQWSSETQRGWVIRSDRSVPPPRLVYVPSRNRLRCVDLAARTVATVFESPEPIESVAIGNVSSFSNRDLTNEQPILVRTRQKIYALSHQHEIVRDFTIPIEIDPRSTVLWYETGTGLALAEFSPPASTGAFTKEIVYRIADDGAIRDRFELTLQSGSQSPSQETQSMLLGLGLPAPAILLAVQPVFLREIDRASSYPAAIGATLKSWWPSLTAVLALSSVLAVIAWRRSRAFGLSRREQIGWTALVLLLGLPGFVGFLLHRRWPVREPCPICHTRAARDRAACAECDTRFPEPALKGIEVFA